MSGLQCDAFNATVYRLALDSVVENATFSDEVCTDVTADAISVMNEVTVPLVLVFKYDLLNVHEYVTNTLNASVNDNSLSAAIVPFATQVFLPLRGKKEACG